MFFVFQHEITVWHNHTVRAKIQGSVPRYQPHWWNCEPIVTPLALTFEVDSTAPMPDNYFTGTIFDLYSNRLISYLQEAGVQFETFLVAMVDSETKQKLNTQYEVFHLLEKYPGLDRERSDIDDKRAEISKLVLTESCLKSERPLFRLQEKTNIVLIREDLRSMLDAANITGCKYTPIDEFQVGIGFHFEKLGLPKKPHD